MKRHSASRQNPEPNPAAKWMAGLTFPRSPIFTEGLSFTDVIGTTTASKPGAGCAAPTGEGAEESGSSSCAAAAQDREKLNTSNGTIPRGTAGARIKIRNTRHFAYAFACPSESACSTKT